MASQTFDDLDSLSNRSSEVFDTYRQVADVDVVRSYSVLNQSLNQFSHDVLAVVNASQQYGLIFKRNTCVSQLSAGFC